jgi:hypothetical protein
MNTALGYRLGLHNVKYKAKIEARKRFRDAFAPEFTRVGEERERRKTILSRHGNIIVV